MALSRVEPVDGVEGPEEDRVLVAHQRAHARHFDAHAVAFGVADGTDQPLLVADDDALSCGYFRHSAVLPDSPMSSANNVSDELTENAGRLVAAVTGTEQQRPVKKRVVLFT